MNIANINEAFFDAIMTSNLKLINDILNDEKCNFDVDKPILWNGLTPLQVAVSNKNYEVAKLLVSHGASKEVNTYFGESCLHLAVMANSIELINLFLPHLSIDQPNEMINTPLYYAVWYNKVDIAEFLLSKNAEVNTQDLNGFTPLHIAVRSKYLSLIELLLVYGADPNVPDGNGDTAFHETIASLRDHKFIKLCLQNRADVNLKNKSGENALHLAVRYNLYPVAKQLLEELKMNVNEPTEKDKLTPLHLLIEHGVNSDEMIVMMGLLVSNGADVDLPDKDGQTPIYKAVHSMRLRVPEYLISLGADIDGNDGHVPLLAAIENMDVKMFEHLLALGARTDFKDDCYRNLILVAIDKIDNQQPRLDIVKSLIERGVDVNDPDIRGTSAAMLALESRDNVLFKYLLENGARVDVRNDKSKSLLHLAVEQGMHDAARILIGRGLKVNDVDEKGKTILSAAVRSMDEGMARLLLDNGASPNELMLAARSGSVPIMHDMVLHGARIDHRSPEGHRIFVEAIIHNQVRMVRYLLELGADVTFSDDNKFALGYALRCYQNRSSAPKKLTECLMKRLAIMDSMRMDVGEENRVLLMSNQRNYRCYTAFVEELDRMRVTRICGEYELTYHDLLVRSSSSLMNLLNYEIVHVQLRSGDYKKYYPQFWHEIDARYACLRKRAHILQDYRKKLHETLNGLIPMRVIGMISEYASDLDLDILLNKNFLVYKVEFIECSFENYVGQIVC